MACHVTVIGEMAYKKYKNFEVFWEYLNELLIFLHEFFAVNIKSLIISVLGTLETGLKVSILAIFDDFAHFSS